MIVGVDNVVVVETVSQSRISFEGKRSEVGSFFFIIRLGVHLHGRTHFYLHSCFFWLRIVGTDEVCSLILKHFGFNFSGTTR